MDEASIISALQADLQDYKIKTQIRRKESQLHILLTRADGDDVDYAVLYDIVKHRIDKLPIEGSDSLTVYGRLAGAKHPEWQKNIDIKPPLPLIELDLEELENLSTLDNIGHISLTTDISIEPTIDTANTESNPTYGDLADELKSFKSSIEHDLEMSKVNNLIDDRKFDDFDEVKVTIKAEDADLTDPSLQALTLDDLNLNKFELDDLAKDTTVPFDVNIQAEGPRSPLEQKQSWEDDDFNLNASTVMAAVPMPLPPAIRKPDNKLITEDPEKESVKNAQSNYKSIIFSSAFVLVAISIVGTCGWLMWDRSNQQQSLAKARNFSSQAASPKKITKLETLTENRNNLQTIISQLEVIPDRPASLYSEAQTELQSLKPQLTQFDRKVDIEQLANKNLESAKNITIEAAKTTKNPPHKSTVWLAAQDKRQQALKMLEQIPTESLLYADAQKRLVAYRAELVQIKKWVEIQKTTELLVNEINPETINQLKQLKSKVSDKQKFVPQCQAILQPQVSNANAQKVGNSIANVTIYLCGYFWD